MELILYHPEVADRSCEDCRKWMYDHQKGKQVLDRQGQPVPRPPQAKPPCEYAIGQSLERRKRVCAKISPSAGLELNARNWQAYLHYLECRAVGQFPDDPIVRQNAQILRSLHDAADSYRLSNTILSAMVVSKGG